jgi:hypothetical protein
MPRLRRGSCRKGSQLSWRCGEGCEREISEHQGSHFPLLAVGLTEELVLTARKTPRPIVTPWRSASDLRARGKRRRPKAVRRHLNDPKLLRLR